MGKILGIDFGEKRIGLALSDSGQQYAFTFKTLENKGDSVEQLQVLCQQEGVTAIVMGLPLDQTGADGPAAAKVRAFAETLGRVTGLSVIFEDERFSTVMAAVLLRQAGKKSEAARPLIDQHSAQIILQTYLDKHHG